MCGTFAARLNAVCKTGAAGHANSRGAFLLAPAKGSHFIALLFRFVADTHMLCLLGPRCVPLHVWSHHPSRPHLACAIATLMHRYVAAGIPEMSFLIRDSILQMCIQCMSAQHHRLFRCSIFADMVHQ
jgi:hypothetical protein